MTLQQGKFSASSCALCSIKCLSLMRMGNSPAEGCHDLHPDPRFLQETGGL